MSTFVPGISGSWIVGESCGGCEQVNPEVSWGVTSESSIATTSSWTVGLESSVEEGIDIGEDAKSTETVSVSTTISMEIESSYSVSKSYTCGVTCGNGTKATWTVWQWRLDGSEYVAAEVSPFGVVSCYYVCNQGEEPKCPPGFCIDYTCMKCKPPFN